MKGSYCYRHWKPASAYASLCTIRSLQAELSGRLTCSPLQRGSRRIWVKSWPPCWTKSTTSNRTVMNGSAASGECAPISKTPKPKSLLRTLAFLSSSYHMYYDSSKPLFLPNYTHCFMKPLCWVVGFRFPRCTKPWLST